ncbi:MAG TPA: hypothetical protein VMW10_13095 [Alphaproteobacteria bacterium]|nr:hypothetical protein [Alphaproteobacteria bacterium]
MFRLFLLNLIACSSLIWGCESQAMHLEVPEDFPGHDVARQIRGDVKVPNEFNPGDYQQNKHIGEAACNFNSLLAGIMHTPFGRSKVQAVIESQDETSVNFRFYFPSPAVFEEYKYIYESYVKEYEMNIEELETYMEQASSESDRELYASLVEDNKKNIEKAQTDWKNLFHLEETSVKVPKKFVTKSEGGSFPQNDPDWLNLMQQAYMKVTKNKFLPYSGEGGGYSTDNEILEEDAFLNIPFCGFSSGYHYDGQECLNLIEAPEHLSLRFFPFIDIPLKSVDILTNREIGLDLHETKDLRAKFEGDVASYETVTYTDVVEFARTHGLTKTFLMAPNVLQFGSATHAVALIFSGEGKVYYYDNVVYDPQIDVYGEKGPIYQEAKYFKGQDLEAMTEIDFFTRLFQEIDYRKDQVYQIRKQEPRKQTTIKFFTKPLLADE